MKPYPLVFRGKRFPNIRVEAISGFVHPRDRSSPMTINITRGAARDYLETGLDCWWRDLGDVDFTSLTSVGDFIVRRGDPSGALETKGSSNSRDFQDLAFELRDLAALWGPEDPGGLSSLPPDQRIDSRALITRVAQALPNRHSREPIDADAPMLRFDGVYDPDAPFGFALHVPSLAEYLLASASHSLIRKIVMRRCDQCRSWFDASNRRAGARFCSNNCRYQSHVKKET